MIYKWAIKIRHHLYDEGLCKSVSCDIPTICVGNVTVGGTGKTPHTELIIRLLRESAEWGSKSVAVLSRGYRRKSRSFQNVRADGSASMYGDEPLQIKRKFPDTTVVVDKNRVEACNFLRHPELLETSRAARRCLDKSIPAADLIILDDAFQYRKLKAGVNIVLVDYNRPVFEDSLLPFGNLRDLPERIRFADIVIVTKCPEYISDEEKAEWKKKLNIQENQHIFFTTIKHSALSPVYPEGDTRYSYSKKLVLFSGIANDTLLRNYLSDTYRIIKKFAFPDHHRFSRSDIRSIESCVRKNPTVVLATTEKDAQRILDIDSVPDIIRERLFSVPIEAAFLSDDDKYEFENTLIDAIKNSI